MSTLTPFTYADHQVRVVTINTEPWFVLADLCKVLSLGNGAAVASRIDPSSRGITSIDTLGGPQRMSIVSEAGMYEVVIRSDKPEAVAFRRWITQDVLPSIRKHGGYLTPEMTEQVLSDPDTLIRLATDLKAERQRRQELEVRVEADAPKVLFADAVSASQSTILIGELAKILRGNGVEIGQNRLFARLREDGYLIRRQGSDYNAPTQRAMELGLFKVKETAITHSDGHVSISKTTKVTGKGQQYFVRHFLGSAA